MNLGKQNFILIPLINFLFLGLTSCSQASVSQLSSKPVRDLVEQGNWTLGEYDSESHDVYIAITMKCADPTVVEEILELLTDEDPTRRVNIVNLLTRLRRDGIVDDSVTPSIVDAVLQDLVSDDAMVRVNAFIALSNAYRGTLVPNYEGTQELSLEQATIDSLSRKIVSTINDVLTIDESRTQILAAQTLVPFHAFADETIPNLNLLLSHEGVGVRVEAATALAYIDPDNADEAVQVISDGILNSNYTGLGETAINALGLVGPTAQDAIPSLLTVIETRDNRLKIAAAEAIAVIDPQGEQSVPDLVELLNHDDPDVRRIAATTLGMIGPPAHDALETLKEMLEDPVEPVREVRGEIRAAIEKIESEE